MRRVLSFLLLLAVMAAASPAFADEIGIQQNYITVQNENGTDIYDTAIIPLVPGRVCFGWRVNVGGPDRVIRGKEILTLSRGAVNMWGDYKSKVSKDKTTAVTAFTESVVDGSVMRSWCIVEGDPPGIYTFKVTIAKKTHTFTFCAVPVGKKEGDLDPRKLSCATS
jgi:hypothetical protein